MQCCLIAEQYLVALSVKLAKNKRGTLVRLGLLGHFCEAQSKYFFWPLPEGPPGSLRDGAPFMDPLPRVPVNVPQVHIYIYTYIYIERVHVYLGYRRILLSFEEY